MEPMTATRRGVSEAWVTAAVAALRAAGGRLDHVELAARAGVPQNRSSGRQRLALMRELIRRGLVVWDGYKTHTYPTGRTTSREAYRLVPEKTC